MNQVVSVLSLQDIRSATKRFYDTWSCDRWSGFFCANQLPNFNPGPISILHLNPNPNPTCKLKQPKLQPNCNPDPNTKL